MPLNPRIKSLIEIGILLGSALTLAIAVYIGMKMYSGGLSDPLVAVSTGSMMPIYNGFQDGNREDDIIYPFRGDILLIRKVSIESIEPGDVIVFDTSFVPEPVVHRVIAKWSENGSYFFKTNGDNNERPDAWIVYGEDVKGIVVLRIPHIGWFLLALQTLLGRLILIATAILILFMGNGSDEDKDVYEEEKEEMIDSEKTEVDPNNHKSLTSKSILSLENIAKIFNKRYYIYITITLIIMGIFIFTNILAVFAAPPSTEMYLIQDNSLNQNLIKSTNSSPYVIYFSGYSNCNWTQGSNNNTTNYYFFPIKLKIQSGGFLNNINRIDIIATINETIVGTYRWNIVYNYIGTRILKGGIIASLDSPGTYYTSIILNMSSRGLLASNPRSYSFPLILEI